MTHSHAGQLLIVDDEAVQSTALARTLIIEGYDATEAHSAAEALSQLREHRFDVLITDLMMPDLDGVALLRAAQTIDENLVGVVMTGHGTIDTAVAAMKSGALDYILKPFNLTSLLPVVSRALTVRRLRLENTALLGRVAERNAELEALNRNLERANSELRGANAELDAFAATVVHDVRQPLHVMAGFAELLLEEKSGPLNPTQKEYLNDIHQGGQRLFRLIDDLLRFARLGRASLTTQTVDVLALVQSIVAELRQIPAHQRATVNIEALPAAEADPALLKQVFANILSNALKFTHSERPCIIEVTGSRGTSHNSYSIRDNGIGFDMQGAGKLFGIFHRLPGAERFAGSGLGLSIARRIIERHDGRISAESAVGRGACFTFTLPVAKHSKDKSPARGPRTV